MDGLLTPQSSKGLMWRPVLPQAQIAEVKFRCNRRVHVSPLRWSAAGGAGRPRPAREWCAAGDFDIAADLIGQAWLEMGRWGQAATRSPARPS